MACLASQGGEPDAGNLRGLSRKQMVRQATRRWVAGKRNIPKRCCLFLRSNAVQGYPKTFGPFCSKGCGGFKAEELPCDVFALLIT